MSGSACMHRLSGHASRGPCPYCAAAKQAYPAAKPNLPALCAHGDIPSNCLACVAHASMVATFAGVQIPSAQMASISPAYDVPEYPRVDVDEPPSIESLQREIDDLVQRSGSRLTELLRLRPRVMAAETALRRLHAETVLACQHADRRCLCSRCMAAAVTCTCMSYDRDSHNQNCPVKNTERS